MDKRELLKLFEAQIASDLAVHTHAALAAREAATHAESKPEDEYDTRGVEASYLAGAQSKRAMELQELAALYHYVDLAQFTAKTPIASTAVIELTGDGKEHYYLLMPKGGGMSATFEGKVIHVVTPQSPLGSALLGRHIGDEVEVRIQGSVRDYEITAVW